jgi:hypothetical protein
VETDEDGNLLIKSVERKSEFLWFIFANYGELIFSPRFVIQNYGKLIFSPTFV